MGIEWESERPSEAESEAEPKLRVAIEPIHDHRTVTVTAQLTPVYSLTWTLYSEYAVGLRLRLRLRDRSPFQLHLYGYTLAI